MIWKPLRKWSLTKQFLLLYILTIILIIVMFFTIMYTNSLHTMTEIGTVRTQSTVDSSNMQLSNMVDDIEYQFFLMQNNNELHYLLSDKCEEDTNQQIVKLTNILNSYDVFHRKIEKFELFSLTKNDYPSVNEKNENIFRTSELYNDVWFNDMLESNYEPFFSVEERGNEIYITVSRLIADTTSNSPIAIIKMHINANVFYSYVKDIKLMQSGKMFISTDTHILNPSNDSLINSFINNKDIFNKIIPQKIQSSLINTNNAEYRIFCYPLQKTGLYLVAFVDVAEFNMLGQSMIISTLTTSLLLMFFIFFILYFVSSAFIKPIRILSHDMASFDDAPSKPSINLEGTSEEISSLYQSYEKMRLTINELLEDIKKKSDLQRETEFRVLQAQIKPHFLYNTLGSISALADNIDAKEIKLLSSSLATYFRTSLNNGKEFITLKEELEQVSSYAEIQKMRYPNKFELKLDVNESILNQTICKLILQPLVENCIAHAFIEINRMGIITISGDFDNDDIVLKVSDNGYGLNYISLDTLNSYTKIKNDDELSNIKHFGIYNISQRIQLYYGENYGLNYTENEMGGITATIRLSKFQSNQG